MAMRKSPLEAWRDNGWDDLSPKTSRRHESAWEVHIRRSIGRRRIASIGPYDVERYFRSLKSAGQSEGSVRMIRAVVHRACRLARGGEAAALRRSDLDVEAGTLRVDKAVVAARGGAELRSPKTRASMRTVAVDADTLAELADLRERQAGLATSCGLELAPGGFVFSYEPGGSDPPHPDTFSHGLARTRSKGGVASDVHLHSLRHFHATVVDSVISEAQKQARLGWSTVQMARHYTDAVAAEDRRAAEHVARLLAGAAVPSGAE
jgi:integrase